jgi:hypothetical protein
MVLVDVVVHGVLAALRVRTAMAARARQAAEEGVES